MRIFKTTTTTAASMALVMSLFFPTTASAATVEVARDMTASIGSEDMSSEAVPSYFVTAYDGTVWAVSETDITALSFEQWRDAGFPTPQPAPTDYVKYPWSPTISAVTFFGKERDRWVWRHLSLTEWRRAGTPAPRHAGWIEGSYFYQWATSGQIFVRDVGGVKHALTPQEWVDSGSAPFETLSNQGFARLTWDASIGYLTDIAAGQGRPIDYATWRSEGFPEPAYLTRFPGDQVFKYNGEADIIYAGPTQYRRITYAEWGAMGYPAPTINRIGPVSGWNCPSWAPVKGNANSGIYHVPGGRYYEATNPEECFRSETAARGAGYRRSQL